MKYVITCIFWSKDPIKRPNPHFHTHYVFKLKIETFKNHCWLEQTPPNKFWGPPNTRGTHVLLHCKRFVCTEVRNPWFWRWVGSRGATVGERPRVMIFCVSKLVNNISELFFSASSLDSTIIYIYHHDIDLRWTDRGSSDLQNMTL